MHLIDLAEILDVYDPAKVTFVGLGQNLRGDDYAGIYLLRKLKRTRRFKQSLFIEAGNTPENYIYPILSNNPEAVVFIDAAVWGGSPGEIRMIVPEEINGLSFSTHSYSIGMIAELLQAACSTSILYIGIEPYSLSYKKTLSAGIMTSINNFINSDK